MTRVHLNAVFTPSYTATFVCKVMAGIMASLTVVGAVVGIPSIVFAFQDAKKRYDDLVRESYNTFEEIRWADYDDGSDTSSVVGAYRQAQDSTVDNSSVPDSHGFYPAQLVLGEADD